MLVIRLAFLLALSCISIRVQAQTYNIPLTIPPLVSGSQFQLDVDTGSMQFYPGNPTRTFGYNGTFLGPTLELIKGDQVSITINNRLTEETSVHWHGLHVPAAMDGGPETIIPAGASFVSSFTVMNPAAMFWYHPHVHMSTESQVAKGLAGLIIIRDTIEAALPLPRDYGVDDIPVIIQDRSYFSTNQFFIGGLGDSMLVNGVIRPYQDVQAKVIRFRLLNGSAARVYNLGFSDNRNFHVIGSDASLLDAPVTTNRLVLANGERAEILVDFSSSSGDTLFLMSYASELPTNVPGNMPGMGGNIGPLEGIDFNFLQIRVVPPVPGGITSLPTTLVPMPPLDTSVINRTRNRTITGQGMASMGNFYLDGNQYIMGLINDTMRLGDIERWNVINSSNISHPMHIHDISFRIISRNGVPPPLHEQGWKDVFHILPQETVSVLMRFEDYADANVPYMYHCHNLAHEDMGMMTSFVVMDTATSSSGGTRPEDVVTLAPNPTYDHWKLAMSSPHHGLMTVEITDLTGKSVRTETVMAEHGAIIIDTRELPSGGYLISIRDSHSTIKVLKGFVTRN